MDRNAWENDYEIDYPSKDDCELVKKIAKEIRDELMPSLSRFFGDFEGYFVHSTGLLGTYIYGSYEKPIILLDMPFIHATCQEVDADLLCGIKTTIVHELGHAIQDWFGVIFSEKEAEGFARQWYRCRKVDEFWDGFETPELYKVKTEASI